MKRLEVAEMLLGQDDRQEAIQGASPAVEMLE
jgi:hypothetical protein